MVRVSYWKSGEHRFVLIYERSSVGCHVDIVRWVKLCSNAIELSYVRGDRVYVLYGSCNAAQAADECGWFDRVPCVMMIDDLMAAFHIPSLDSSSVKDGRISKHMPLPILWQTRLLQCLFIGQVAHN